jgi:hypothetical protein
MARRTVRSNGGKVRLGLGAVRVIAPKGAIRKGKTLTIRTAPPGGPGGFSSTGADSLAGGPYIVSTSQGNPSRPVTVRLRYEPGSLSEAGRPLVLHGWGKLGDWVPEKTRSNRRIVSATLDSFSPLDVVDDVTWWAGRITGNRTELPGNCGEVPSWITAASFPRNRNEALPSCISNRTDAGALRVNIVNNRGYAQFVTVSGARVAAERSGSWSTSVDSIITNELARRSSANGPSSFVLGPGASATIALDRPLDLVGQRSVVIRGAPRGGSAVGQLAWTLVSAIEKVKKKVSVPRSVTNCVTGVLYNSTSSVADAASSISALRSCLQAGAGLTGIAKAALKKIGTAVLVTDVFHKVIDLEGDEAFPPRMEFVFQGTSKTNPDIELGNLDVGTVPAGKTTTWRLTAAGGTPPYAFAVSTISKNIGRVPDWVSLHPDGTLSISPPANTNEYIAFSVFVVDATGRRSATAIYEVTFYVNPPASPSGIRVSSERFSEVAAGNQTTCGVRIDDVVTCWGATFRNQANPPPELLGNIDMGLPSCGLTKARFPSCWGQEDYWQLAPPPMEEFTKVSVGYARVCGLRANGTVLCWWGPEGGTSDPGTPVGTFIDISLGDMSACGLRPNGEAECWMPSSFDGDDPLPGSILHPGGSFVEFDNGGTHLCGRRISGTLACWGSSGAHMSEPPSGSFGQLSLGFGYGCAIRSDDVTICWGQGERIAGLNGNHFQSPTRYSSISTGSGYGCGLRLDGHVECWGANESGQSSPP